MKKRRYLNVILILVIGLTLIAVSSFAGNRINLVESGTVSIERLPGQGLYFHALNVHQEGNEVVVSGSIKRRKTSVVTGGGHIDIAVINPEGKVLEHVSTRYVPKVFSRESHRGSVFSVYLPLVPPKGSVVRVARHKQTYPKSENKGFDCGENVVTPM